jgi:SAM-dependent methyltransferase
VLEEIRHFEAKTLLSSLSCHGVKNTSAILELGAGGGYTMDILMGAGYSNYQAFDLVAKHSNNGNVINFYDGKVLSIPDKSIDCVITSNVIAHVEDLDSFFLEIRRVLKDGGLFLNVLPTSSWRLWTNLTIGINILLMRTGLRKRAAVGDAGRGYKRSIFKAGLGHRGNVFTQLYEFARWSGFFKKYGWQYVERKRCALFYTGVGLVASNLSIKTRNMLSYVVGSSSKVYAFKK